MTTDLFAPETPAAEQPAADDATGEFAVSVDLANPGQFLACCGLLVVADALGAGAVGHFDGGRFVVRAAADPLPAVRSARAVPLGESRAESNESDRLAALLAKKKRRTKAESSEASALQDGPLALVVGGDGRAIRLDWWRESATQAAGFKTWSGGQHALGFVEGMLGQMAALDPADPFAARPLRSPKPFYFDSRVSRLTSLDLGFSPDGFAAAVSPAVELLAMVGLQWFRPATVKRRAAYAFATWPDPLPLPVAAVAGAGLAPALADRHFRFPLVRRTGGKYKAFGPAVPADAPPSTHEDPDA